MFGMKILEILPVIDPLPTTPRSISHTPFGLCKLYTKILAAVLNDLLDNKKECSLLLPKHRPKVSSISLHFAAPQRQRLRMNPSDRNISRDARKTTVK